MKSTADNTNVETSRRGYSDEEIDSIYELARFSAENGDLRRAEVILSGLVEVAPDFAPAWLGMSYLHVQNQSFEAAANAAKNALRINPQMVEAELFLAACQLTLGDYNAAGTLLGEVQEKIEEGQVDNPNVVRFFRMQMARYENR